MSRILIVLTSHATLGDTGRATGFYWEELAIPYMMFGKAGHAVDLASIAGGQPPADPASLETSAPDVAAFMADPVAVAALSSTLAVASVDPEAYDAVYLPGGHGTMWDLPGNEALSRLLGRMCDSGRVIGAVCHGPAGLLGVLRADGQPIVAGRRVSGFTDSEETAAGLAKVVPFLLETRMLAEGGLFKAGPDGAPQAVRDGTLVTGQNPASSALVASLMLEALAQVGGAA